MLRDTTLQLLCQGARATGTFSEGVEIKLEEFDLDQYDEAKSFAKHIDANIGGASRHNIEIIYSNWKNPKIHGEAIRQIKATIQRLKKF